MIKFHTNRINKRFVRNTIWNTLLNLKVNNIGYLWNDLQWNYVEGIYLPEVAVRLGITWDFWN